MADEMKTKPATLRLAPEDVEDVERYRADREKKLRRMLPGYNLSQAGALWALMVRGLQAEGYRPTDDSEATQTPTATPTRTATEATDKPVTEERRKAPRSTVKPAVLRTEREKKRAAIEADLIAGEMTQRAIALKWGKDEGRISKIAKALREKGLLS